MEKRELIDYKFEIIKQINKYRNSHGVRSLRSDYDQDKISQNLADEISKNGSQYNGEETVYKSENLISPVNLAQILYNENVNYDYKNEKPSNFTKMIWKKSILIGFGMQKTSDNKYVVVIRYFPPGNILGEFSKNVFPSGIKYSQAIYIKPSDINNIKPIPASTPTQTPSPTPTPAPASASASTPAPKQNTNTSTNINTNKKPEETNKNVKPKKELEPQHQFSFDPYDYLNPRFRAFILECLEAHNNYRRTHHAPPLVLNKDLCQMAETYSKHLADNVGELVHSVNRHYKIGNVGENLYYCKNKFPTGTYVTSTWYDEIKEYDYNTVFGNAATGHFSQVVWKGTTDIGVGCTRNEKGQLFVVAHYYPCGNLNTCYKENVLRP